MFARISPSHLAAPGLFLSAPTLDLTQGLDAPYQAFSPISLFPFLPRVSPLLGICYYKKLTSVMAQRVQKPGAMQETQETRVQSLGREDPLEKEMATHSSILGWKPVWTEELATIRGVTKSQTLLGH